mmetsp:Transcript_2729/g.3218  ORF Transcript_2729/g.3218 Transcript_2729/m.3218 type:complete len:400 (-) Transcript_2729:148-1347(-)
MISHRKSNPDERTALPPSSPNAESPRSVIDNNFDIEEGNNHDYETHSSEKNWSFRPFGLDIKATKLLFGVIGIYISYLYYGTLQEEVYTSPNFHYIWFVQVIEALANMSAAYLGLYVSGRRDLDSDSSSSSCDDNKQQKKSQTLFMLSGASQVCSKALTSLSLANGLSFPLAVLAKSGKMAPVMLGQLVLGNTTYSIRDYIQVSCIIAGTCIVGLSKAKNATSMNSSSPLGVFFIVLSLFMDGLTGGIQKRIKENVNASSQEISAHEFMLNTNTYMMMVAFIVSILKGEILGGIQYCLNNSEMSVLILRFCICSSVGQSFIFYTIANFDPLVCSTVTTTRKVFSVLLSIWYKGHILNHQGWCGIILAVVGVSSEVQHKVHRSVKKEKKKFHKGSPTPKS